MKLLFSLVICLFSWQMIAQQLPQPEIKINPGKYFDYYHFNFQLTQQQYQVNQDYGFNSGGQFEVLVDKAYFPIPAPNCRKNIIIRMPYSVNETRKRALYDKLSTGVTTAVTLELNPYVKQINDNPVRFELEYCNVFFRHKAGDYFDQL